MSKRRETIARAIDMGHQLALEAVEDDLDDEINEATRAGMNSDYINGLKKAKEILLLGRETEWEID